jgi:hypothetical protein
MFVRNMKKIHLLILATVSILFSSCLEIVEDVKVNKNGSGTFKLIVNLSQSKSTLDKILSQDSIQGQKIPQKNEITSQFNTLLGKLKTQVGINNVVGNVDLELYKIDLSFGFDKVESLNLAVNNIISSYDKNAPQNPILFTFDGKTLTKTYNSTLLDNAYANKEKASAFLTDFDKAKLTCIARFETEIVKANHETAQLSSTKKNCIEHILLNQLLTDKELHTFNFQIQ